MEYENGRLAGRVTGAVGRNEIEKLDFIFFNACNAFFSSDEGLQDEQHENCQRQACESALIAPLSARAHQRAFRPCYRSHTRASTHLQPAARRPSGNARKATTKPADQLKPHHHRLEPHLSTCHSAHAHHLPQTRAAANPAAGPRHPPASAMCSSPPIELAERGPNLLPCS